MQVVGAGGKSGMRRRKEGVKRERRGSKGGEMVEKKGIGSRRKGGRDGGSEIGSRI